MHLYPYMSGSASRSAGVANDTVACLHLLIYLCVSGWAEPTEVSRNDYRALQHLGIDGCQPEAPGYLLWPASATCEQKHIAQCSTQAFN